MSAPPELYDEDYCITALTVGGYTRGQARAFFAAETGENFTTIRVVRTAYRYDHDWVAEQEADGIKEPYDGWPWWECGPGQDGVPYWKLDP